MAICAIKLTGRHLLNCASIVRDCMSLTNVSVVHHNVIGLHTRYNVSDPSEPCDGVVKIVE